MPSFCYSVSFAFLHTHSHSLIIQNMYVIRAMHLKNHSFQDEKLRRRQGKCYVIIDLKKLIVIIIIWCIIAWNACVWHGCPTNTQKKPSKPNGLPYWYGRENSKESIQRNGHWSACAYVIGLMCGIHHCQWYSMSKYFIHSIILGRKCPNTFHSVIIN